MEKFTVLVEAQPFCAFDNAPLEKLKNSGLSIVDLRGSGIKDDHFIKALKQAGAVLCGNDLQVNDELFAMAPNVKALAKLGVGLDTVDIDAASRHGVIVFHTPGANNQAVADHTFALLLCLARKLLYCDRSLRQKRWNIPESWQLKSGRKPWASSAWGPSAAVWRCGPAGFR